MTFNEYQTAALSTAIYPKEGSCCGPFYLALGVAGEAGEIADKLKKVARDHNGEILDTESIAKEIGDVLWYLSCLSYELGYSFNDIAEMNISKLNKRKENNTLHGEGDNR